MCITKIVKCWHCGEWFEKTQKEEFETCPHCSKGFEDLSEEAQHAVKATLAPFLLLEGKVLNTMEICRNINHQNREACNSEVGWKMIDGMKINRSMINVCKMNGCKINYFAVVRMMHDLLKDGLVKKRKMRFWDNSKSGKRTDIFSFWYLDDADLYRKILCQTLEGYINK